MPRPREFDEDKALGRALDVFWREGYQATSIDRLVRALGVNRASLYAAFGDKRALYQAALDRYRAGLIAQLVAELDAPGTALEAIERVLTAVATSVDDGRRRGCFVTQTALELCPGDAKAERAVREFQLALEDAFEARLARARVDGELPKSAKPRALARFFVGVAQGLIVLSKTHQDSAALRDVIGSALAAAR